MKDSGISIRIWGHTEQSDAAAAERRIMLITKSLLKICLTGMFVFHVKDSGQTAWSRIKSMLT